MHVYWFPCTNIVKHTQYESIVRPVHAMSSLSALYLPMSPNMPFPNASITQEPSLIMSS